MFDRSEIVIRETCGRAEQLGRETGRNIGDTVWRPAGAIFFPLPGTALFSLENFQVRCSASFDTYLGHQ